MRYILPFILTTLLVSCFGGAISFEKDYYERITGMKFPKDYQVLETFDNGEWLTGTVFEIDTATLQKFVQTYNFQSLKGLNELHLHSLNYLDTYKPNFASIRNIYFSSKSKGKNSWTYVADLNSGKLWSEISYPDWGGQ